MESDQILPTGSPLPPPYPTSEPVLVVASAAVQTLRLAGDLLTEAAQTLPSTGSALDLRHAIEEVGGRIAASEPSPSSNGLAEVVVISQEVARLCEIVATRHRRSSPAALACARLVASSADLALEALTEIPSWTSGAALSRRARQLIEIHQLRDQLNRMATGLNDNFPTLYPSRDLSLPKHSGPFPAARFT